MSTSSNRFMILFTILGLICGFALAALILPTGAPARAADAPVVPGSAGNGPVLTSAQSSSAPAAAANHDFTYQGVLRQTGTPFTGFCDFKLALFSALTAGTQYGADHIITNAPVSSGQFTLQVAASPDFPDTAFDGRSIFLQTSVSCPTGLNAYTLLTPRQAINPAPLASALVQNASLQSADTSASLSGLNINAPSGSAIDPTALQVSAGGRSAFFSVNRPTGIWADSSTGYGIWATTDTGTAILATVSDPSGIAANLDGHVFIGGSATVSGLATFDSNVTIQGDETVNGNATLNNTTINGNLNLNGNLVSPRFKSTEVLNQIGPLPVTSGSFSTSGGTLLVYFSGSGYTNVVGKIGMDLNIDGVFVERIGIYANNTGMHLAFVARQVVLTGIPPGPHTITLSPMDTETLSDSQDLYYVTILELPY